MKNRIVSIITIIFMSFAFISFTSVDADAKRSKKKISKKRKTKKKKKSLKDKMKELQGIEKDVSDKEEDRYEVYNFFVGAGAGYYLATGNLGNAMNGGVGYKGFVQYNRLFADFFGIELESGYTSLNDREIDGSMSFSSSILSGVFTFRTSVVDFDLKTGAGINYVTSNLPEKSVSSVDLTLGAGVGISKTIYDHYVFGVEGRYYYIFESLATGIISASFYMGYRF